MRIEVQKMINEYTLKLKVMGYSKSTIETYSHFFKLFISRYNPHRCSVKDIDIFLLSITGYSSHNQAINAIRFYYKNIAYSKLKLSRIKRPRKQHKIPTVLGKDYIVNQISSCNNLKHKCMMLLLYGSGLRISEVLNLKATDIHSDRMILNIRDSKGNKDRNTIISIETIELLRKYYKAYRPKTYLFNGQENMKYSATSLRKVVGKWLKTNPHTLRHSFATHLIESGVDISKVSKLLGHSKLETTMIYNHVKAEYVDCLV
jgi:integrase/recombinase XerD